jgi:probable addiction module antidote protein
MSEKFTESPIGPQSSRREIVDYINHAFATSDIAAICQAIRDATRLHSISDIARDAGIERTSIYRAFSDERLPSFPTVLRVLGAMGLQLKVTQRRGNRAKLARNRDSKSSES